MLPPRTIFYLSLLAPLPGMVLGAFVANHLGVPWRAFAPNFLAIFLGVPFAMLISSRWRHILERHPVPIAVLMLSLMSATLLFPGMECMRRWVPIGPIALNMSALTAPTLIYCLGRRHLTRSLLPVVLSSAALLICMLQPDAGQGTAIGCAIIVLYTRKSELPFLTRLAGIITSGLLIFLTGTRHDPLAPVMHVEQILRPIVQYGPIAATTLVTALAFVFTPLCPVVLKKLAYTQESTEMALALIVYLLMTFVVTEIGHFPVPVIGAGASPVIGWYTIAGLASLLESPKAAVRS